MPRSSPETPARFPESERFGAGAIPEIRGNKADITLVYARLLYRNLVNHGSGLIGFHLVNAADFQQMEQRRGITGAAACAGLTRKCYREAAHISPRILVNRDAATLAGFIFFQQE